MYTADELRALGFEPYELGEPVDAAVVQADHAEYRELSADDLPGVKVLVDGRRVTDAGAVARRPTTRHRRSAGMTPRRGWLRGRVRAELAGGPGCGCGSGTCAAARPRDDPAPGPGPARARGARCDLPAPPDGRRPGAASSCSRRPSRCTS